MNWARIDSQKRPSQSLPFESNVRWATTIRTRSWTHPCLIGLPLSSSPPPTPQSLRHCGVTNSSSASSAAPLPPCCLCVLNHPGDFSSTLSWIRRAAWRNGSPPACCVSPPSPVSPPAERWVFFLNFLNITLVQFRLVFKTIHFFLIFFKEKKKKKENPSNFYFVGING